VCAYVGTIGMAHGLEVVVEAASMLKARGRTDIAFLLVGDGASRRRLEDDARAAGVTDLVVFTGRQPKQAVPAILASSDACLIHLRKCELFGTVIPSKIFETMAMGRPIIMGVRGQARDIVMAAGAGVAMEPESAQSLIEAADRLAAERRSGGQRGASAREYLARHFDRDALAARYLRLLEGVAASSARPGRSPAVPTAPAAASVPAPAGGRNADCAAAGQCLETDGDV